jgi:phosphatidate cytidylyltransferase
VPDTTEDQSQPELPEKARRTWRRSLGMRWATALVAIPIVLVFVWFGGWAAFAAILLVAALCIYELHSMLLHASLHPIMPISMALSVLFLVAAMFPQQRAVVLEIGVSAALIVSFVWLFFRQELAGAMIDWSLTLAIAIYIGWPLSFFLLLRGYTISTIPGRHGAWIFLPRGVWWMLVALLGVWGNDIAAFFTGHYFGRHQLAPRISPAKTWEGVAGGLVLSIVVALVLTVGPLGVPWYLALVLGVLICAASVLGDLAESLIKRQTHVKDSGQMMPGHGGILDRADSMLFTVMVVYAFAVLVGI